MKLSTITFRKHKLYLFGVIFCGWLVLFQINPPTAMAQNSAFTFQGKLADGGNPANGTYDLEFKLYDAATGGTLLGTVTRNDTQVASGIFSVRLDYGTDVFSTGSGRYLEIGVRPGASTGAITTITPRQELTASPYSIQAARADKAIDSSNFGGNPPSSYLRSNTSQTFTGSLFTIGAGSTLDVQGALLGNGSNLFNLNANNVTGGTLADARLSGNIPRLNTYNIFTGGVQFNSPPIGSGEFLTNLTASSLTGTVPDARLSNNIPRLNLANTFSGFNAFTGTTAMSDLSVSNGAAINRLSVGGGLAVTKILTGSATLDFGNDRISQQVLTVSVPGARVGDAVYLGIPENVLPRLNLPPQPPPFPAPATTITQPFIFQAYVSAPDVVAVTWDRLVASDGTSYPGPLGRSACLESPDFFECQPPPGVFRVVVFSFAP